MSKGRKMVLQRQNGAAAVEFALILPFLVLLVYGTIEFGLLLYNQQVLTNASREGARAAIVGKCADRLSNSEISQIVNEYCIYTDSAGKTIKRLITFNAANMPTVIQLPSLQRARQVSTAKGWRRPKHRLPSQCGVHRGSPLSRTACTTS
jgi:hypothetical protein